MSFLFPGGKPEKPVPSSTNSPPVETAKEARDSSNGRASNDRSGNARAQRS
jgi:hypothetical protein